MVDSVEDLEFGRPVAVHIQVGVMAYGYTAASVAGLEVEVKVPCSRRLAVEEQVMLIGRTAVEARAKLNDRTVVEVGVQAMRRGRMAAVPGERATQIVHMMVAPASAGRARRVDHKPGLDRSVGRIHSFRSPVGRELAVGKMDGSDKTVVEVVDTMDTVVAEEVAGPVDRMMAAAPAGAHHRNQTMASASWKR